jgi:hypothetical protein
VAVSATFWCVDVLYFDVLYVHCPHMLLLSATKLAAVFSEWTKFYECHHCMTSRLVVVFRETGAMLLNDITQWPQDLWWYSQIRQSCMNAITTYPQDLWSYSQNRAQLNWWYSWSKCLLIVYTVHNFYMMKEQGWRIFLIQTKNREFFFTSKRILVFVQGHHDLIIIILTLFYRAIMT